MAQPVTIERRGAVTRMPDGWTAYPVDVRDDGQRVVDGTSISAWPTWEEALAYVLGFLRIGWPLWLSGEQSAYRAGLEARAIRDEWDARR